MVSDETINIGVIEKDTESTSTIPLGIMADGDPTNDGTTRERTVDITNSGLGWVNKFVLNIDVDEQVDFWGIDYDGYTINEITQPAIPGGTVTPTGTVSAGYKRFVYVIDNFTSVPNLGNSTTLFEQNDVIGT